MSDIPKNWGVMEYSRTLRTVKKAAERKAKLDHAFLASMLRAAHQMMVRAKEDTVPVSSIEERLKRAREEGRRAGVSSSKAVLNQFDAMKSGLAAFKQETGMDLLWDYSRDRFSEILKDIHAGRVIRGKRDYGIDSLESLLRGVKRTKKELDELEEDLGLLLEDEE
jgi:hypothetical protein